MAPPATIQDVLKRAFHLAEAVVVLFTPDDRAHLDPSLGDEMPITQPRANVLVEAGMALGLYPERTVFVRFKGATLPSDLSNYVVVEFDGNEERARKSFRGQLLAAQLDINGEDEGYLMQGTFG